MEQGEQSSIWDRIRGISRRGQPQKSPEPPEFPFSPEETPSLERQTQAIDEHSSSLSPEEKHQLYRQQNEAWLSSASEEEKRLQAIWKTIEEHFSPLWKKRGNKNEEALNCRKISVGKRYSLTTGRLWGGERITTLEILDKLQPNWSLTLTNLTNLRTNELRKFPLIEQLRPQFLLKITHPEIVSLPYGVEVQIQTEYGYFPNLADISLQQTKSPEPLPPEDPVVHISLSMRGKATQKTMSPNYFQPTVGFSLSPDGSLEKKCDKYRFPNHRAIKDSLSVELRPETILMSFAGQRLPNISRKPDLSILEEIIASIK